MLDLEGDSLVVLPENKSPASPPCLFKNDTLQAWAGPKTSSALMISKQRKPNLQSLPACTGLLFAHRSASFSIQPNGPPETEWPLKQSLRLWTFLLSTPTQLPSLQNIKPSPTIFRKSMTSIASHRSEGDFSKSVDGQPTSPEFSA